MKWLTGGCNPRQLLYSTVITNNGKNNKKSLKLLSSYGSRNCSSSQVVGEVPNANPLDWMKNLRGGEENERLLGERGEWWWTGKKPTPENLKELSNHSTHVSSLPQLRLKGVTEANLRNQFDNTWLITEVLFSALQGEEAFYRPPYHSLRHPKMFYYGHPATFYTNKLRVAGLTSRGIDPAFEELFEVGVDEMRWDDISTLAKDWPSVSEVHDYRKKCHQLVSDTISEQFEKAEKVDISWEDPLWCLVMAIEHERIHIETSSVLMRELPINLVSKPKGFPDVHPSAHRVKSKFRPEVNKDFPENQLLKVEGQRVSLGKTNEEEGEIYGWDNEYGSRTIDVPSFQCTKFKVTNGEFYEFVKEGGYRNQKFWSTEGWGWRRFRNAKWPTFWVQRGPAGSHDYALRTVFEEVDMQWDWPVNANYHEASAFCNWKAEKLGKPPKELRLITEAEFMCIRDEDLQLPLKAGCLEKDLTVSKGACDELNNNLRYGSESPVDEFKPNTKGFKDVFGNVWEWTEDDFNPLGGYEVHPFYDDFSSPCFDGEHNMILGGSFASSGDNGGNIFSRYHFRPHFHQHAGFRYVMPSKSEPKIKGQGVATFLGSDKAHFSAKEVSDTITINDTLQTTVTRDTNMTDDNSYETERLLDQYLALHFGQQADNVNSTVRKHKNRPDHALNFAQRSGDLLVDVFKAHSSTEASNARALDVGCAVGGATFQMAETFSEVIGMDYSINFVKKATEISNLPEDSVLRFQVPVQGNINRADIKAQLPPLSARQKTQFVAGDATKLDELNLGEFDAVLCANLLCRLPEPRNFLEHLGNCVRSEGIVVFLSPYSWLDEFTPKENWLATGDKMSAECLKDEMKSRGFEVVHEEDVPLIIREHERKYQYIISHGLAFKKM